MSDPGEEKAVAALEALYSGPLHERSLARLREIVAFLRANGQVNADRWCYNPRERSIAPPVVVLFNLDFSGEICLSYSENISQQCSCRDPARKSGLKFLSYAKPAVCGMFGGKHMGVIYRISPHSCMIDSGWSGHQEWCHLLFACIASRDIGLSFPSVFCHHSVSKTTYWPCPCESSEMVSERTWVMGPEESLARVET